MRGENMKGLADYKMQPYRFQLLHMIAVVLCLTLCGCSHQEDKTLSQQTEKTQQGASRNQKSTAKSAYSNKTPASHFSGTAQPETETVPQNVSGFEVSFEPANPVTGDQLKAKVRSAKASEDEIPLTYLWSINGDKVQESADPTLTESIKCGDFVELQVGLSDNPQDCIAAASTFIGNAPPVIALTSQNLDEKGLYLAQLEVADPEQDQVALQLTRSPTGMQIDSATRTIQWTIGPEQQGAFDVAVSAKDSRGAETLLTYQIKVAREERERTENNGSSSAPAQ